MQNPGAFFISKKTQEKVFVLYVQKIHCYLVSMYLDKDTYFYYNKKVNNDETNKRAKVVRNYVCCTYSIYG